MRDKGAMQPCFKRQRLLAPSKFVAETNHVYRKNRACTFGLVFFSCLRRNHTEVSTSSSFKSAVFESQLARVQTYGWRMFITTPDLKVDFPKELARPGSLFWSAALLSTEAPWFLVTHCDPREQILQTIAVAWETTLVELVDSVGVATIVRLSRVSTSQLRGSWQIDDIEELWIPSDDEGQNVGPLLLRVRGEAVLRDCLFGVVPPEVSGRTLFLKLDR